MKRNTKLILGAALALGAAYIVYTHWFAGGGEAPQQGGAMPAPVATVEQKDINPVYRFTGRLSSISEAQVRPQVSGLVEAIHFKEGDMVKQGQPLVTLDLRTFRAALAQGQAAAEQARLAYERGVELRKQDAISQADLDGRRAAWKAAEAQNTGARVDMDHAVVKAPIAGRVGRPEVTLGNVVDAGPGAPVLTTIQQVDPMYVDFEVNEQTYLGLLSVDGNGAPTMANAPVAIGLASDGDDYPLRGTLSAVDNRFGADSGSLRMRATLANPTGALLPGLFARVALTVPVTRQAILINDAAVGTDQANRFVYKVGADNTAQYQKVQLGDMAEGLRVITDGLQPGDRIIVGGLLRTRPGMPVQPIPADMSTTQPLGQPGASAPASPTAAGPVDGVAGAATPSPTVSASEPAGE